MNTLQKFQDGDIRALSRVVSFVEDRREGYRQMLSGLYKSVGRSLRVGVTGPPGAGKSTLVNGLIHQYLKRDNRVGVIAVDPTSPFTGGALLGDRVRMNEFPTDGSVYFRSMATRGASGGLTSATSNVTLVYDAFGFDITLIETVGVGQVELDIIDACDVVIVVIVPESGDAVQTLKAGLMEIADIFCVNKADRPGWERIASELKQTIAQRKRHDDQWSIPIVPTEAVQQKNIDKLFFSIEEFVTFTKGNGLFDRHRREQIRHQIMNVLKYRFQRDFIADIFNKIDLEKTVNEICAGRSDPFTVGDQLYSAFTGK